MSTPSSGRVHPVFMPEEVAAGRSFEPPKQWRWVHVSACVAADGSAYVLSRVRRVYTDTPRERTDWLDVVVLTRYAADGMPVRHAAFTELDAGGHGSGFRHHLASVSVLPGGWVAVSDSQNRTVIVDPISLEALPSGGDDGLTPGGQLAFRVRPTPSGRLLCQLGQRRVTVSEEPLRFPQQPRFVPVTQLHGGPRPYWVDAADDVPHTRMATDTSGWEAPYLDERLDSAGYGNSATLYKPWIYDAVPLDDSHFVALVLTWPRHAVTRGGDFCYAIVSVDGRVRSRLELDCYRDGAGRRFRHDVVVDRSRRRIFHLNTFGLYVFDESGARLCTIPTQEKEYRGLGRFQLRGFSGEDELVLVEEENHMVLRMPVPDGLQQLPDAVSDGLAAFRRARTRLMKQHDVINWYWRDSSAPVVWHGERAPELG